MKSWRIGTEEKGLDVKVFPSLLLVGKYSDLLGISDLWKSLGGSVIPCHTMLDALTTRTRPHAVITQQGLAVEPYPGASPSVTAEDEERDTPPFDRGPRVARELLAKWPGTKVLVMEARSAKDCGGADVLPLTETERIRQWMRETIATSKYSNGGQA